MKKTFLYFSGLLFIGGISACNSNSGTTSTTDSSSHTETTGTMTNGDSSTTTTTTVTHHRYRGSFMPKPNVKYVDLRTHKQITIKLDTTIGRIVNMETNEPVDLFIEPNTMDTIYGQTGTVVNNDLIRDASGSYMVDTTRLTSDDATPSTTTTDQTSASATPTGNYKEKEKRNKSKLKTDDVKIKEKGDNIKIKER